MVERPTGTVTFLFTDVEGSTRAWEEHPRDMGAALAKHDAILTEAIESRNGYVFATGGDAFSAAFSDPLDAATVALEVQQAMSEADWGPVGPLRVRMALHTGITEERDGDYFGPPLNRTARIMSAASGGEVLLSETTAGLLRHLLPPQVWLHDLGERRLADLEGREHIFELSSGPPTGRSRRRLLIAATAGGLLIVAGVVVGLAVVGSEPTPTTTPVPTTGPDGAQEIVAWTVPIGPGLTAPVVSGGVVVTGQGTLLQGIDIETGEAAWEYDAFTAIESSPATDESRLILTSGSRIIALDASNGNEIWQDSFSLQDASPAAVHEDLVLVGASNEMYGYLPDSGKRAWEARTFVVTAIEVRPAAAGSSVFVGGQLDQLYALGMDGQPQWQTTTLSEIRPDDDCREPGQINAIVATQVRVPGRFSSQAVPWALTVDCQGYLKAWHESETSSTQGTEEWSVTGPITAAPAISGLTIYAMDLSGELLRIDLADGTVSQQVRLGTSAAPPVVDDRRGVVWVTGEAGMVWAVNLAASEILFTFDLEIGIVHPVALAGDLVIVADVDGGLTALRPDF